MCRKCPDRMTCRAPCAALWTVITIRRARDAAHETLNFPISGDKSSLQRRHEESRDDAIVYRAGAAQHARRLRHRRPSASS